MKNSVWGNVLLGIGCLVIAGCEYSESGFSDVSSPVKSEAKFGDQEVVNAMQASSEELLHEFSKVVEGKLSQLKKKQAKLTEQVKKDEIVSEAKAALDATLDDLTKKGEAVQIQIEALKAAKGDDWLALQPGVNQALEDMDQAYEKALVYFAG